MTNLLKQFALAGANPHWIFVSSTSVYGQSQGEWIDENSIAKRKTVPANLSDRQNKN